jgi:23S rRNA (guanosine2251-2'-O)-methyltransferase
MNNNSPYGKSVRSLAASHQRSWLWGRHAIMEMLAAGRWPVLELLVDENQSGPAFDEFYELIRATELTYSRVSTRRLTELCKSEDHQGFLAQMAEFPCGMFGDLQRALQSPPPEPEPGSVVLPPLYVICDRLQDAHNFGAILRSCDAMRVDGIVIGEKSQASITPHVARASSGAVNHLTIYRVPSLADAVSLLKTHSVRILAATEKSERPLWQADTRSPLAVVIGSEAIGIAPELLAECETQVAIPMLGGVASLNAAVAAGIVLYECRRQQMSSPA